jgi:hypothetical protein
VFLQEQAAPSDIPEMKCQRMNFNPGVSEKVKPSMEK